MNFSYIIISACCFGIAGFIIAVSLSYYFLKSAIKNGVLAALEEDRRRKELYKDK